MNPRNLLIPLQALRDITLGAGMTYLDNDAAARAVAKHCLAECLKVEIPAELTPDGTGVQSTTGTLTVHHVRREDDGHTEFLLFAWAPESSNPAFGNLGDPFAGLPTVTIDLTDEPPENAPTEFLL